MIRSFVEGDIPAAMRLKEAAGWNQVEQDWLTVIGLAPRACWVCEKDGRVVGTVTAISYGRKLAWIGMMLVDPQFRRRGIGRSLMEHAVAYLDGAGVETIKLDATDMGYPLYRGLGFQDECRVERWSGTVGPVSLESQSWDIRPVVEVDDVAALDQEAFGVSRTEVLRTLLQGCPQGCFRTPDGYVMARPGSTAHYLGPCVARDRAQARMLIEKILSKHSGELMFWDVLPGNELAVQLAEGFGFTCARKLRRMWRPGVGEGSEIAANLAMQFAVAGFEFG